MKKFIKLIMLLSLVVCIYPSDIKAEDYSDTEYWESYCDRTSDSFDSSNYDQVVACRAYYKAKLADSNSRIQELEAATETISSDIQAALEKARNFESEAAAFDEKIASLTYQIKELMARISELEQQIAENQALVEELNERVLTRMANAQKTMHFNPLLDFLLGAKDFTDLSRRTYGIQAIMSKDKADRDELIDVLKQLEEDEAELEEARVSLDNDKIELEVQQAEYYALQEYYDQVAAQWEVELENIMNALESEKVNYASIAHDIDVTAIPSSAGFISPAQGASISAGTWYYPSSFGGGVHLGVDYALGLGAEIVAPANGVIIISSDGCGTGYLGNSCAGNGGGVAYGGNQVIMMCASQGNIYAISFSHLLYGSPHATGVVAQGEVIGRVGSSGNSTGPHCHIELFYLGEGDADDLVNDYLLRSYSLSFNCGWGYTALNRLCENGVGAPCRLKPENYFGG